MIIGIAASRPVRFMAKAPLFEHPVLGPPMSALGMVPAFRGSDDQRQVHNRVIEAIRKTESLRKSDFVAAFCIPNDR